MSKVKELFNAELFMEHVQINQADIGSELMKQPAIVSYYGSLHAKAKHQVDLHSQILANLKAEKFTQLREKYAQDGLKLPTLSAIEAIILSDKEVVTASKTLVSAKYQESELKNALEALRHKKDCLVQLSANARQEMSSFNYSHGEKT